jgi:uncharacterized protein (DUF1810 family)
MRSSRLERFKVAQDEPGSGYESALAEMRTGRKRGHWIWYVFPQLSGLGMSDASRFYGINGADEAEEYLKDPVLLSRLLTITGTVAERLEGGAGVPLETLMGSSVDVLKLVSSLTLFAAVAKRLHAAEGLDAHGSLVRLAEEVLAVAEMAGYPPCRHTRAVLKG